MDPETQSLKKRVAELEDQNELVFQKLRNKDVELERVVSIFEDVQAMIRMLDERTQSLRPL